VLAATLALGTAVGWAQGFGRRFRLPEGGLAGKLRSTLLAQHRINIRAVDVKQWNGLRASLHMYNDEAQVDAFVRALRESLPG